MSYCRECGQEHHDEAQYCPRCGASVGPNSDSTDDTATATDGPAPEVDEDTKAMYPQTRRQWMKWISGGIVGTALLAGTGQYLSGPEHSNAGEAAWTERERTTVQSGSGVVGTVTLEAGEYTGYSFDVQNGGLMAVVNNVQNGPLDVWTVVDDDLAAYQSAQDDILWVSDVSQSGVEDELQLVSGVPPGKYWIIVDNTAVYGSEPDGKVTAKVGMGAGRL